MALLRAAIYCRCSTEEESQIDALNIQVEESEACVKQHGWFLADRYVESKSGTTTRGRNEYNRLFGDLMEDKFDVIVIKSQDRLMRNVKDWYLFLDRMVNQGKLLYMYIEQKFYTTEDTLITGIKAILAEEYSRELSKKINNAHHHRQLSGGRAMLTSKVFGFRKKQDGSLEIVEEEADVIRKIYEYSAVGYGSRTIANLFLNQGYRKRNGKPLTATSVGRIIRNPLYKGTMVMNRLHYDFEKKKTIKVPEEQWIFREGAVPAIVSPKAWQQANEKMSERARVFHRDRTYKKGCCPGQYSLSGKLVCGQCKKPYYRTWRRGYADKEKIIVEWKCSSYLEKGRKNSNRKENIRKTEKESGDGCDGVNLNEETVFTLLGQVCRRYYDFRQQDKDGITRHTVRILQKVFSEIPTDQERKRLEEEQQRLQQQKDFLLAKFLEQVISEQDYQRKDKELGRRIAGLYQRKSQLEQKEREIQNPKQRIETIKSRMEKGGIEKAAIIQMLHEIREIRVHEWHLEIYFEPRKSVNPAKRNWREGEPGQGLLSGEFMVKADYPFGPETKRGRYLDRRRIMDLIRENPRRSAQNLAEDMGRSPGIVRNRMQELTKDGYIRFCGRGQWEILKELPEKEVSFREGTL